MTTVKAMPQTTLSSWLNKFQVISQVPKKDLEPLSPGLKEPNEEARRNGSITVSKAPRETPPDESFSIVQCANLPKLPSAARIEQCTEHNISGFRRLNALLLPIPYQAGFYKETLQDPITASVTRIATWGATTSTASSMLHGIHEASTNTETVADQAERRLVAAIRCRLLVCQPQDPLAPRPVLYISTIGTLAPYRGHSLGAHLLTQVTRTAVESYNISAVMAHVWESNEEALAWYMKRGFEIVAREEQYYRRLAPKTAAWLIKRDILPSDLMDTTKTDWSASSEQPLTEFG